MPMRRIVLLVAMAGFCTANCCAQTPPPLINPVGSAVAKPEVTDVLDALHDRGQSLQDFTADVTISEADALGSSTENSGKVSYQRLADGDARIRVSFDRKKIGDKVVKQRREYKLEGGTLIDQNFDTKTQVNRQVLRPGQKLNPLKLGEGPFPLPIGQDREEVLKLFDVTRIAKAKYDPADTAHLSLKPKPNTRFARKFLSIEVYVSNQSHFPVRIETTDRDGTSVRTTDLTNIKINAGLKDGDFKLPEPGRDWGVRDEPLAE
jgi:outer membrane lipoprotein-sorting protein